MRPGTRIITPDYPASVNHSFLVQMLVGRQDYYTCAVRTTIGVVGVDGLPFGESNNEMGWEGSGLISDLTEQVERLSEREPSAAIWVWPVSLSVHQLRDIFS